MAHPNSGLPEFGLIGCPSRLKADLDGPGPESITTAWDYGFRARRFAAPRNDVRGMLRPRRIESLLQSLPAIGIIVLQRGRLRRVRRDAFGKAGLEHEGHGAREFYRLQLAIARVIEGLAVRTVRQHAIVQAHSAGNEAFGLGVVDAIDQPHELTHDVHVIPGRTEGVFG